MRWFGNYILELLKGPWPEIWFIRHGHGYHQMAHEMFKKGIGISPREALGINLPNHSTPLTPLGRWQSEETRKYFADDFFDYIYISQIRRAIETAEIIFPGRIHEFKYDPRLNEKEFGPAHLLESEQLREKYPDHFARYEQDGKYWAAKAPGGENFIDMSLRLHSFLETLRRDMAGKKVAIICHSAVMLTFRQLFERHNPEDLIRLGDQEWIENCGILNYRRANTMWGWKNGKFRLRLARAPYKLWKDRSDQQMENFWQYSIQELEKMKQAIT